MIEPQKDTEKELEETYKEIQKSGFINVRLLQKKEGITRIKSLEDLKIPGLDKISPKKIEALNYLLTRMHNQGHDFGYHEWFKDYDTKKLSKAINQLKDSKIKDTISVTNQLIKEIELEKKDVKIEPNRYQSILNRQNKKQEKETNRLKGVEEQLDEQFEILRMRQRRENRTGIMREIIHDYSLELTLALIALIYVIIKIVGGGGLSQLPP